MTPSFLTLIFALFYFVHHGWELLLNRLNAGFVKRNAGIVPEIIKAQIDPEKAAQSASYELSSLNFGLIHHIYQMLWDWAFLIIGFALLDSWVRSHYSGHYLPAGIFIGSYALLRLLLNLPFSLYHDFKLEARFGFNRKTLLVFATDLIKGILIGGILGGILIWIILGFLEKAGTFWWIWAFIAVSFFQLLVMVVYPVLIAPLFNKFTPVTGEMAERIRELADKIQFKTSGIYTMDGSKRSTHSNAYFTGLGSAKRIVFFDTLMNKILPEELLAVLGHEMGHYKLGHIRKIMLLSFAWMAVFLAGLAYVKDYPLIYPSLGFPHPSNYAALIIFSLLFSEIAFPFQYFFTWFSRRNEFAADRFAVNILNKRQPLINALIKLHTDNLSSIHVHPLYAGYHYSHPELLERITAIQSVPLDASNFPGSNSSQKCHNPGS